MRTLVKGFMFFWIFLSVTVVYFKYCLVIWSLSLSRSNYPVCLMAAPSVTASAYELQLFVTGSLLILKLKNLAHFTSLSGWQWTSCIIIFYNIRFIPIFNSVMIIVGATQYMFGFLLNVVKFFVRTLLQQSFTVVIIIIILLTTLLWNAKIKIARCPVRIGHWNWLDGLLCNSLEVFS